MFDGLRTRKRLEEVEERLTSAERQLKALQVEWMDTLDRLKRMMFRVVKDRQRVVAAEGEEPEEATEGTGSAPAFSGLTPKQAEAQRRILARRAHIAGREQ